MSTSEMLAVKLEPVPFSSRGSTLSAPAVAICAGLVGALLAVGAFSAGSVDRAVLFGCLSLALLTWAVASLLATACGRRGWVRLRPISGGVEFVGSQLLRLHGLVLGILLFLAACGQLTRVLSGVGYPWSVFVLVLVGGFAGYLLFGYARGGRSALRPQRVELTSSGMTACGPGWAAELPWSDLGECRAGYERGRIWIGDAQVRRTFGPGELRSDPVLVAMVIDFYCRYPQARPELADGRVRERVRQGLFRG